MRGTARKQQFRQVERGQRIHVVVAQLLDQQQRLREGTTTLDDPAGWQIPDGAIMPSTVPDQAAEEASSEDAEPIAQGVAQ